MNQKGQTLIEVVIGVVLLAVVFTGLFQALAVGIWGTHTTNQLTTAQQIARSEIEYIKAQAYDEEAPYQYDLIDLDGNPTSASPDVDVENLFPGFVVRYSIDPVGAVDPEVLQQITMTVNYTGGKPQQFLAYKANVEYGTLALCTYSTACTNPHCEEFTIPELDGGWGHYYVVTTFAEGPISAFWDIEEKLAIELYIYMGMPFTDDNPINVIPDPEDPSIVAQYEGTDKGVASTASYTVPPGDYTVYFYNPNPTKKVDTISATITYACQ